MSLMSLLPAHEQITPACQRSQDKCHLHSESYVGLSKKELSRYHLSRSQRYQEGMEGEQGEKEREIEREWEREG